MIPVHPNPPYAFIVCCLINYLLNQEAQWSQQTAFVIYMYIMNEIIYYYFRKSIDSRT